MIALIGAGFLGSIFAEEFGKRTWAQEAGRANVLVVDPDEFEPRNAANQNVRISAFMGDNPLPLKAKLAADTLLAYEQNATYERLRVTPENIDELLPPDKVDVIVDAVDNVETRQLLWHYGLKHGIPVLHIGMTQQGTGAVEWTIDFEHDTFSLSPLQTMEQEKQPEVPKKLRPCELIAHRATGFLVAHRGAVALGHLFAVDPEEMFPELAGKSFASSWQVSENGIMHVSNITT